MYSLLEKVDFHCHVSLLEGKAIINPQGSHTTYQQQWSDPRFLWRQIGGFTHAGKTPRKKVRRFSTGVVPGGDIYIYTIHGSCGHFAEALVDFCSLVENLAPVGNKSVFFLVESWGMISNMIHIICIYLGGVFKYFLFSPLLGEDFHFDWYFSKGLKPPTRYVYIYIHVFVNPLWSPLVYQFTWGEHCLEGVEVTVFMFSCLNTSISVVFLEVPVFMFPVVWHGMKYQEIELPPLYLWGFWRNPAPPGM